MMLRTLQGNDQHLLDVLRRVGTPAPMAAAARIKSLLTTTTPPVSGETAALRRLEIATREMKRLGYFMRRPVREALQGLDRLRKK